MLRIEVVCFVVWIKGGSATKRTLIMKKNIIEKKGIYITIMLIVFLIYSIVVFIFVEDMNYLFWCSFVVTINNVIFQVAINEYMIINELELKDFIFKMPITLIGIIFIVLETAYTMVFSLKLIDSMAIMIIIQLASFTLFCFIFICSLIYSIKVNKKEEDESYKGKLSSTLKLIESNIDDLNSKVLMRQLYDMVQSSETESPKEAINIEIQIRNKVVHLNKIADDCDSATLKNEVKELSRLFEERNRMCKLF